MAVSRSSDTYSKQVRDNYNQNVMGKGMKIPSGIYRGVVVNNEDPGRKGRIRVQIMKFYGIQPADLDPGDATDGSEFPGAMWCRQMLPTGGTSAGDGSATTYGSFGSPPENGNEVIVAFGGDTHSGIVLGVLPDISRSDGIAGAGVTRKTDTGETTISYETPATAPSVDTPPKEHPLADVLRKSGLSDDMIRGMNYSSPARDPSSRVSGSSTPAGHSFVMDDGNKEDGNGLGVRLRTAGGAQILMDDTNGLIYINNREGNVWVEINRIGDIDIYAARSMNFHTEGDFNMHCGGNFNLQAGRDINMKAQGAQGIKMEASGGSFNMKCAANMNLQAEANGNIRVAGNYRETAGRIDMNGAPAAAASTPTINQLAANTSVTESVSRRVPEKEPWAGHLDKSSLKSTGGGGSGGGAGGGGDGSDGSGGSVDSTSTGTVGTSGNSPFAAISVSDYPLLKFRPNADLRLDPRICKLTNDVARAFGQPLTISSGFRDRKNNKRVEGAKRSMHMQGRALDISGSGFTNAERVTLLGLASKAGVVGIGVYNDKSLHFDNRDGSNTGWGSKIPDPARPGKTKYGPVPPYARPAMSKHISGGFA